MTSVLALNQCWSRLKETACYDYLLQAARQETACRVYFGHVRSLKVEYCPNLYSTLGFSNNFLRLWLIKWKDLCGLARGIGQQDCLCEFLGVWSGKVLSGSPLAERGAGPTQSLGKASALPFFSCDVWKGQALSRLFRKAFLTAAAPRS